MPVSRKRDNAPARLLPSDIKHDYLPEQPEGWVPGMGGRLQVGRLQVGFSLVFGMCKGMWHV